MTARKAKAKASDSAAPTPLNVDVRPNETSRQAIARKLTGPFTRHGLVAAEACVRITEGWAAENTPGLVEYAREIKERADKAATGDLEASSALLMAQALSLDSIFSEYARIALVNVSKHMDASERYMRLALKAQANSRTTLEALAKLHQPREQTVRHVHVNEGGQAVIAEEFHHHAGGRGIRQSADQPHASIPQPQSSPSDNSPDLVSEWGNGRIADYEPSLDDLSLGADHERLPGRD